jgi:hypothetical protein
MSKKLSAASLTNGSWTARWGAWVIGIRTVGESWHVRIWSWTHGVRVQVATRAVLSNSTSAVSWACEVLRKHGARVIVDGQEQQLEKFLAFSPAPTDTSCS